MREIRKKIKKIKKRYYPPYAWIISFFHCIKLNRILDIIPCNNQQMEFKVPANKMLDATVWMSNSKSNSKCPIPFELWHLVVSFTVENHYSNYLKIHGSDRMGLKDALCKEHVMNALKDYMDATNYVQTTGEDYTSFMAIPRPNFNVRELMEFWVERDRLQEVNRYASWLTCWYHHELQAEVLGRDVVRGHFADYEETVPLYEEEDDVKWYKTPTGWERDFA